jgi:hypothetical protein
MMGPCHPGTSQAPWQEWHRSGWRATDENVRRLVAETTAEGPMGLYHAPGYQGVALAASSTEACRPCAAPPAAELMQQREHQPSS